MVLFCNEQLRSLQRLHSTYHMSENAYLDALLVLLLCILAYSIVPRTFRISFGLRCSATSFSRLTAGIFMTRLYDQPGSREKRLMNLLREEVKGWEVLVMFSQWLRRALAVVINDSSLKAKIPVREA